MPHDIFISYSRRDLAAVRPIKEELESLGFSCWMDLEGIESGAENFERTLVPALDGSKVVLFFISQDSQKSEWTIKELGYAKRHGKRIIPVRFNDDPLVGVFDFRYGDSDIIDWRIPEQKLKLQRDLSRWERKKSRATDDAWCEGSCNPSRAAFSSSSSKVTRNVDLKRFAFYASGVALFLALSVGIAYSLPFGVRSISKRPRTVEQDVGMQLKAEIAELVDSIETMKRGLVEGNVSRFATDKFSEANAAYEVAISTRDEGNYADSKEQLIHAKSLYEEAMSQSRHVLSETDRAIAEARNAKAWNNWADCYEWSSKALEWDSKNATARLLKEEANKHLACPSENAIEGEEGVQSIQLGGGAIIEMVRCPSVNASFWIGKYEVTQDQWWQVMGFERGHFKGKNRPVESVSLDECRSFIMRLSQMPSVKESGFFFRLPTHDEWMKACRSGAADWDDYCQMADGTTISFSTLDTVAWFGKKNGETSDVGMKFPNAWGLFDMHGNVWEWTDTAIGATFLCCGGGFDSRADICSSSSTKHVSPDASSSSIGFRLAADLRSP